jgi:hypothetical protein
MTLLLKNFVVWIYLLDSDVPSRGTCVILPQLPLPEMGDGDGSQMDGGKDNCKCGRKTYSFARISFDICSSAASMKGYRNFSSSF